MLKTGSINLDKDFLYPKALNCIYGEPATGKTTLCLMAAASEQGKVIFLDTENSFSINRIEQIKGRIPDNIFLIKVRDFKEQCKAIENLLKLKGKISLVIIDSLTFHYRKELQEKKDVNSRMSRQLSILSELAREGIPILATSQVYATFDNKINPVGNKMLKNWSGCIIRLEKEPRKLIIEKHPENKSLEMGFDIVNEGISVSGA